MIMDLWVSVSTWIIHVFKYKNLIKQWFLAGHSQTSSHVQSNTMLQMCYFRDTSVDVEV